MPRNRYVKWGGLVVLLILANIANYIYWNWGLITVHVTDAPLSKVIRSIEWQGWVTIYTNLAPDAKVSMDVDRVPLAEAMETLAANVGGPPVGGNRPRDGAPGDQGTPGGNRPAGGPPGGQGLAGSGQGGGTPDGPGAPGPGGQGLAGGGQAAGAPGGQGAPGADRLAAGAPGGQGAAGADRPAGGAPGGQGFGGNRRGGGFGGGGFGGGAQWNLAFFVAPTYAGVKSEIHAFESGATDDDTKIYNYPTPFQLIAGTDDEMPAADPRLQSWPGIKPDAPPAPAPAAPATAGDAQTADTQAASAATPPVDTTPTTQTYLQDFARSANIWIMSPGSWTPNVASAPPPNSSIISAVENFVSRSHGSVTSAIILRVGRGGGGGGRGGNRGGFANMDDMADRMRNAISGLPEDAQADALNQLNQEVGFYHDVRLAPQDQQQKMIRDHLQAKIGNGNNWRRSPEKRAQFYQRVVANRETAQGKK